MESQSQEQTLTEELSSLSQGLAPARKVRKQKRILIFATFKDSIGHTACASPLSLDSEYREQIDEDDDDYNEDVQYDNNLKYWVYRQKTPPRKPKKIRRKRKLGCRQCARYATVNDDAVFVKEDYYEDNIEQDDF
jgi:hypothetical protein